MIETAVRAQIHRSIVATAVSSAAFASNAFGAAWEFSPRATLSVGYEDNVRMTDTAPIESDSQTLRMQAKLSRVGDALDISMEPTISLVRYAADQSFDRDEGAVDAAIASETEVAQWKVGARYVRDTTRTSELGLTGLIEDVDRRHDARSGSAQTLYFFSERWAAGANVDWSRNAYADNTRLQSPLYDYDYARVAANTYVQVTERLSIGVDLSAGRQTVDELDVVSKNYAGNVTAKFGLSERWTLSAAAGPSRVTAQQFSDDGAGYSAAADFRGERISLNTTLTRDVIPTGNGSLSRSERIGLTTAWKYSERLSVNAGAQWVRSEELFSLLGIRVGAVRYARLTAGMNWNWTPKLSVSASVDWTEQERDATVVQPTATAARGLIAAVGIAWSGLPKIF